MLSKPAGILLSAPVPISSMHTDCLLLMHERTVRHCKKCEETKWVSWLGSVRIITMCIGSLMQRSVAASAISEVVASLP
ncbi:hypothetical protein BpHYR1_050038 [Brachionus plicatilis]|uniref:Uncharacterized protein n=1 Tax=Brachionus plicatilis TaxID=10195 RepID=A0A3M7R5M2_BRAPC|nr:hypothetical protein BpHYR1_050038 [Brachionus plicatilis]